MILLIEALGVAIVTLVIMVIVIIVVEQDKARKWGDIFEKRGRDE